MVDGELAGGVLINPLLAGAALVDVELVGAIETVIPLDRTPWVVETLMEESFSWPAVTVRTETQKVLHPSGEVEFGWTLPR